MYSFDWLVSYLGVIPYAFFADKYLKKYFIDLLTASYHESCEVKSFKQVQNIIETDFILTKENNNSATRMEPRISAGDSDDFYSKSNFTRYATKIVLTMKQSA